MQSENIGRMRGYNLFIKFYSPMVFYHLPILDSILAYCIVREKDKKRNIVSVHKIRQISEEEIKEFYRTIEHNTCFYPVPMTSCLLPIGKPLEFLDNWKKRFESKYSRIADFGKSRRRIDTSSGPYRSYRMPLPAKIIQMCIFAFIGDGERVLQLIEENLVGMGKKTTIGFGWIDKIELKPVEYSCFDIAKMRPIPITLAEKYKITGRKVIASWKFPYWQRENVCECIVPE